MRYELTVKALSNSITTVTDFINWQLEAHDCSMKAQMQIDVVIDEIFANIASYAYGDKTGDATVATEFDESSGVVEITFSDEGMPFDPLAKEDPDVTLSADDRQIGGLGIFIVKKTMDDVRYERKDGKNSLTICKKII